MRFLLCATAVAALFAGLPAWAQTRVTDPWARGTVAPQQPAGVYLTLQSPAGGRLVEVKSPLARAEMHEMAMDGDVMRMREISSIDLPPGRAVALKPGGLHLMLMGLKAPLKAGQTVPLTLVVEGRDGKRETLEVQAPVKSAGGMHH